MHNFFFATMLILLLLPDFCIGEITSKVRSVNRNSFYSEQKAVQPEKPLLPSTKFSLSQMVNYQGIPPFMLSSDSNNSADSSNESGLLQRAVIDLEYGLRTTVSDFLHIYSSPSRMNKSDALIVGGILVLGGVIYAFDQEIYDMLNRNKNEPFYRPVREIGEFFEPLGYMGFTNKYLLASVITGYIFNIEPLLNISADILELNVISGAAKIGASTIVGRRRPAAGVRSRSYKSGNGTSFFSGHSLNIVQIAAVLSYHYDNPAFKVTAYSVAATVCLQRITSSSHWPSDVYSGVVVGWFISHELMKLKRDRKLSVTPVFRNDTQGMDIRIAYRF